MVGDNSICRQQFLKCAVSQALLNSLCVFWRLLEKYQMQYTEIKSNSAAFEVFKCYALYKSTFYLLNYFF